MRCGALGIVVGVEVGERAHAFVEGRVEPVSREIGGGSQRRGIGRLRAQAAGDQEDARH
jgi:hypothetical protein